MHLMREDGLAEFPERAMAIWHLDESLELLETYARILNFVGFGSSAEYDVQRNRAAYLERVRQANDVLDKVEREHGRRPWVHLMRGLGVFPELVRFESADSANVAVNHNRYKAEHGADAARFLADRTRSKVLVGLEAAEVEAVRPVSNFHDAPTLRPVLA